MENDRPTADHEAIRKRNAEQIESDRRMRAEAEAMQKRAEMMMNRSRQIIQNPLPSTPQKHSDKVQ